MRVESHDGISVLTKGPHARTHARTHTVPVPCCYVKRHGSIQNGRTCMSVCKSLSLRDLELRPATSWVHHKHSASSSSS